jgi:hypothetical protein
MEIVTPPQPSTPQPELASGWQWVDSHWAAYWLMTNQGIDNRKDSLETLAEYVPPLFATLRWMQEHPGTSEIFQKILKVENPYAVSALLSRWYLEAGLLEAETGQYAPELLEVVLKTRSYQTNRLGMIASYFSDPVIYIPSERRYDRGRHRTYVAWRLQLPEVFLFARL